MAEPTEPESLEETQARLAAVGESKAPRLEVPHPLDEGRVAPDPYAPAPAPPSKPAPRPTVFVGLALVLTLGIGGAVASFLLFSRDGAADQEVWVTYPAVAGADTDDILAQPPLEAVELTSELLLTEYRNALTAELGLEWTQVRDAFSSPMPNGYDGESMLWYLSTAAWEGSVTVDDPAARQTVLDVFTEISDDYDLDDLAVRNELLPGDPNAEKEFGAAERADQALWSFTSWGDEDVANLTLSSEVIDLNVPRGAAFDGDFGFSYWIAGNTLYVTVEASAPLLLRQADTATFIERLAPFEGLQSPQ